MYNEIKNDPRFWEWINKQKPKKNSFEPIPLYKEVDDYINHPRQNEPKNKNINNNDVNFEVDYTIYQL